MKKFEASELTLNAEGKVYHLGIGPEDIADTIILVGDPDRVSHVGKYFDAIRFETRNREFATITGSYKGKEISVMSTGIGTDNVDIVLNELDAAVNIDLQKRVVKESLKRLKLIRIGTCGSLREEVAPGSHIISRFAIGLDGLAGFYGLNFTEDEKSGLTAFKSQTSWSAHLNQPYLKKSSDTLFELLQASMVAGITVTANGFYGPQGRAVRIPLGVPDFKDSIRQFTWNDFAVSNLEMETSALYALSDALGHDAVTVCLVLANRYTNTFEPDYHGKMGELIQLVLNKLV